MDTRLDRRKFWEVVSIMMIIIVGVIIGMAIMVMMVSLLKSPFGPGIGMPTNIATNDCRLFDQSVDRFCDLGPMHGFRAPLHPADAIVKLNDLRRRNSSAG